MHRQEFSDMISAGLREQMQGEPPDMRKTFTIDGQQYACFDFADYRVAREIGLAPADGYVAVYTLNSDQRESTKIPYTYSLVCAGAHYQVFPPDSATPAEIKAAKACIRYDHDVVSLQVRKGGMEGAGNA